MTGLYVWLAALLIGSGGVAGIVIAILKSAKKAGQKQAEADYATQQAENAKIAGAVVAEHRTAADASKRLRDSTF